MKFRSPITGLEIQTQKQFGRKYTTNEKGEHMEAECRMCHKLLPVVNFTKRKAQKIPYDSRCKKCAYAKVKVWRESNPKKWKETYKKNGVIRKIKRDIIKDVLGEPTRGQKSMWDGVGKWHKARRGDKEFLECVFCHTTTWKYHAKGTCRRCYQQNMDKARWMVISEDREMFENIRLKRKSAYHARKKQGNSILKQVEEYPDIFSQKTQNAQENLNNLKVR